MKDTVRVYGTTTFEVSVDPVAVLEKIDVGIPHGDWVVEDKTKDGKTVYMQMTEVSAGQHSFSHEAGIVSAAKYERYKAKELLIEYLKSQRS